MAPPSPKGGGGRPQSQRHTDSLPSQLSNPKPKAELITQSTKTFASYLSPPPSGRPCVLHASRNIDSTICCRTHTNDKCIIAS
eukprot:scaffold574534_cov20-Prasinocladus_malaysianus.AAC.1